MGLCGAFVFQPRQLAGPMLAAYCASALLLALGTELPFAGRTADPPADRFVFPRRGWLAIAAASIAVALVVWALREFRSEGTTGRGWLLWLAAVALLVAAAWPWK